MPQQNDIINSIIKDYGGGLISLKYTLHRALSLKKTTAERIAKEISEARFIEVKQGNKNTVKGVTVSEVEEQIKSSWQRIRQLISNYVNIKSAILLANVGVKDTADIKKLTVAGKSYTMADLIFVSDEIYGNKKHPRAFLSTLLSGMKSSYTSAVQAVERQHEKIENNINDYLVKAAATDKGMSAEDIKKRSEMFHQDGDYTLIDPLQLKDLISNLEKEIDTFRTEADAAISENNALTTIEVNLTE